MQKIVKKFVNLIQKVWKVVIAIGQKTGHLLGRIPLAFTWHPFKTTLHRRRLPGVSSWSFIIISSLVFLYIVGGSYFAYQAYKTHRRSPIILIGLSIYPLPAVIVDGRYITVLSTLKQLQYIEHFSQKTGQSIGGPDEIRQKVVDRMIEGAIVSIEAKKNRLRISDKEVQAALDKIIQDNGGEKPVLEVLRSFYGMSLPEFKRLIRDQLLKQKVKEHALVRISLRHILLSDENQAKEVLEKVKNNGNFDELAKEFSQDSNSRDKGGDLGFVNRGQSPKEVEEVAFKLKPSEVAPDLVKSSLGIHIVRVDARNDGTIDLSYDDFIKQFKEKHRIIRFLK